MSISRRWRKNSHSRFRIQGYGSPSAGLCSYAYADLPEGEGRSVARLPRHALGVVGQPSDGRAGHDVESFTWLHSPVFRATPLDVKAEADTYFLQGVNQIICHGWPYSDECAEYPGWSFYAAAVFNEKNPWWIVMPDLTMYLQRVSHILRQGMPANDIALYLANSDAWAGFGGRNFSLSDAVCRRGCSIPSRRSWIAATTWTSSTTAIARLRGKVDGDTLAFGDVRYKAVVLPGVERVPLSTMQTLEEFARGGGIVVATRRLPDLRRATRPPSTRRCGP